MEILDLKSIKNEIKNSPEPCKIRFELTEESIGKLEDRSIEIMKSEEKIESDLKRNSIKQYIPYYITGPLTYRNVIFDNITKKAQK